jgi:phage terminase large subunit-like protein
VIVTVPRDDTLYPTLGPQVCDFIEQNLVFGPGDLRGQPVQLDTEKTALIYRCYEVYPPGHPRAGRRRIKRAGISLAKGLGKTELAAWVTVCELHPDAPVRCTGFTPGGEPIGGPVTDPYIPLVAYNEAQSDELAYGALKAMCEESRLRDDFDIGLERIERKRGDGRAVSLSSSPNARDGARTTFCVMDETHRWVLPRLKLAHQTMSANLAKRKLADPWMLEITTAPEPGAGSVAEDTMNYARQVEQGVITNAAFFFFHRQASDSHDLLTIEGARAAVLEASGEAASWRDIEAIVELWQDPTMDRAYWERVWCNRLVQASAQAFDVVRWKTLTRTPTPVAEGDLITLGFDGAQFHDATAVIATHVPTGYQWLAGLWECPPGRATWQVPVGEVDAVVRDLFARFTVWRLYADPPYWQSWIATWQGAFGEERVIEWWTNRYAKMARAVEGFHTAITDGSISHDGHPDVVRHLGSAKKQDIGQRDEQGKALWVIRKDRPDSPHKIDAAVAAVLSWEARTDAIAAGAEKTPEYHIVSLGGR